MKRNEDFDFIKSKFDSENISAPESLDKSEIIKKLDESPGGNIISIKNKKNIFIKTFAATAACFAIVAASVSAVNHYNVKAPITQSVSGIEGIVTYSSYDELSNDLKAAQKEYEDSVKSSSGGLIFKNFAIADKMSDGDMAAAPEATGETNSAAPFAQTNKQVDAVDEADIVKTDGKYIYYLSDADEYCIAIFSANEGKTEKVSSITLDSEDASLNEFFLSGDRLYVIGTKYSYSKGYVENGTYTTVFTYDISDRSKPELVDTYEQSGYYSSSRMLDGCIYLISNYGYDGLYGIYKNYDDCIPRTGNGNGEYEKLEIGDICAVENSKSRSYTVVGAIDTKKGNSKKAKAILGTNSTVYCNEKNLYISGTVYKDGHDTTRIVKYSLNKANIKLTATGTVKGQLNDQFSMDEKDGYLRLAITDYGTYSSDTDANRLYVLDKDLNEVAYTDNFARGEHIEAVRFIGDMAYIITYEQTDPLFIMDLSNPKEPKMTGKVKIDGFSSSLTPVDENTLLGIGFATKEEEWGVVQNGLKLALFDISDKNKPKVLDEYELTDASSEAQYTHKAIVINKEDGYFAIPFEATYDDEEFASGGLVIRVKDGELGVEKHETHDYSRRCTYIGKYLYIPDNGGLKIYSFEIK